MSSEVRCPKCGEVSGDDWSQCDGKCPMEGSPHFNPSTKEKYLRIAEFEAKLAAELPDS